MWLSFVHLKVLLSCALHAQRREAPNLTLWSDWAWHSASVFLKHNAAYHILRQCYTTMSVVEKRKRLVVECPADFLHAPKARALSTFRCTIFSHGWQPVDSPVLRMIERTPPCGGVAPRERYLPHPVDATGGIREKQNLWDTCGAQYNVAPW